MFSSDRHFFFGGGELLKPPRYGLGKYVSLFSAILNCASRVKVFWFHPAYRWESHLGVFGNNFGPESRSQVLRSTKLSADNAFVSPDNQTKRKRRRN